MTSPAQLKYLDAMGIPVWVSRDLVIINEKIAVDGIPTVNLAGKTSPSNQASDQPHNAKNILESLEADDSKRTSRTNENNQTDKKLDAVVSDSVSQAKLTTPNSPDELSTFNAKADHNNADNLLFQSPHHYIYAQGSESADWMIIGHSPESFSGIGKEPFAADAGILLDNMLRAVGIEQPRQRAYIVNVLDVDQSSKESQQIEVKAALKQKLLSVIDLVKPKMLLLVGQIAAQNLLDSSDPLIIMRSKMHKITTREIPCVVTYYPSYLLMKPIDKRKAWEDLKLAMRLLD